MPETKETEPVLGGGTPVRVERILCPVDFSDASAEAYRYAQSIAWHYSAKLTVQHVVELWQHPSCYYQRSSTQQFRETLVSNAERELRQFVDLCGGVQPECVVEESMAADAILCRPGPRCEARLDSRRSRSKSCPAPTWNYRWLRSVHHYGW